MFHCCLSRKCEKPGARQNEVDGIGEGVAFSAPGPPGRQMTQECLDGTRLNFLGWVLGFGQATQAEA